MGYAKSKYYGLPGSNRLWIGLGWNENISKTTNNVSISMSIGTRYRINGSWICALKIDGETVISNRKSLVWGSGWNSREIYNINKSYTYTGNKSITVEGKILNMDYYDVDLGVGSMKTSTISFSTIINLQSTDNPPDTPTINCTNVFSNNSFICEDTIDLNLTNISDPDNDPVTRGIYLEYQDANGIWKNAGDQNKCIFWSDSSNDTEYNITKYSRGTRFRTWAISYDNHGQKSPSSNIIDNIYRNNLPSSVGVITPDGGVFKDGYTINWNTSYDIDKQKVTYYLWRSINNGDWESVLSNSDNKNYFEDISRYDEGTSIQYKICACDGLAQGTMSYSGIFKKNTKPTTPTMIFPNSGYYLNQVKITWNNSVDPDGKGISSYDILINGVKVGSSNYNYYIWNIPKLDNENKEYIVSIIAYDNSGEQSDVGIASGAFKKATSPTSPKNILPNTIYHNNNINLSWTGFVSNGINSTYSIDINTNNNGWTTLCSNINNQYYSVDISDIKRGSSIQFRIKCINSFDQGSDYTYSIVYYRSQIPDKAELILPNNNSTVYTLKPRLALNIKADKNNYNQTIIIKSNGAKYSSNKNPELFSVGNSNFAVETNTIFIPDNFKIGKNTIEIIVDNGVTASTPAIFNINVKNFSDNVSIGDLITSNQINSIIDINNDIVNSYSCGSKINYVYKNTYISNNVFLDLNKSITDISNKVDIYSSCSLPNRFNLKKIPVNIKNNDYIKACYLEDTINNIKQL